MRARTGVCAREATYKAQRMVAFRLNFAFLFYVCVPLPPSLPATAEAPIALPPFEYIGKVNDQLMVNISAFVTVKETDYHYVGKETFPFQLTNLKIVVGDGSGTPVRVGTMETVKVTYTNPLQVPLTDAEFTAEGTALMDPLSVYNSVVCVCVCLCA